MFQLPCVSLPPPERGPSKSRQSSLRSSSQFRGNMDPPTFQAPGWSRQGSMETPHFDVPGKARKPENQLTKHMDPLFLGTTTPSYAIVLTRTVKALKPHFQSPRRRDDRPEAAAPARGGATAKDGLLWSKETGPMGLLLFATCPEPCGNWLKPEPRAVPKTFSASWGGPANGLIVGFRRDASGVWGPWRVRLWPRTPSTGPWV